MLLDDALFSVSSEPHQSLRALPYLIFTTKFTDKESSHFTHEKTGGSESQNTLKFISTKWQGCFQTQSIRLFTYNYYSTYQTDMIMQTCNHSMRRLSQKDYKLETNLVESKALPSMREI